MLVHLFEKGMTGIRINLSHADLEEADAWISGSTAHGAGCMTERQRF